MRSSTNFLFVNVMYSSDFTVIVPGFSLSYYLYLIISGCAKRLFIHCCALPKMSCALPFAVMFSSKTTLPLFTGTAPIWYSGLSNVAFQPLKSCADAIVDVSNIIRSGRIFFMIFVFVVFILLFQLGFKSLLISRRYDK